MANKKFSIDPITIGGIAAGLVLGIIIGKFALGANLGNVTATKSTEVSPQQSTEIVANYTYDGKNYTVTLDEMFNYTDAANHANEDGSYAMPTTEQIISYVRQQIIQNAAAKSDISVSEKDKLAYIKDNYGVETIEDLATTMGRTPEEVNKLLDEALTQQKLFESVAGKADELPAFPDYPEDKDEDAKTEAYATYITKLAGDEFKDGKWVDADGEFAKQIPDFNGKTASYKEATLAYQVLYTRYNTKMEELYGVWNEYENEILKDCAISIGTLIQ